MIDEQTFAREVFDQVGGFWAIVIALVFLARVQISAAGSAVFRGVVAIVSSRSEHEKAAVGRLLTNYDEQLDDYRSSRAELEQRVEDLQREVRELLGVAEGLRVDNAKLVERDARSSDEVKRLASRVAELEAQLELRRRTTRSESQSH